MPIVFNKYSLLLPALGPRASLPSAGVGDISMIGRSWVFKPATHPFGNVSLGAGLKFPTGNFDAKALAPDGFGQNFQRRTVYTNVNQPGDGGLGIIVDCQMFKVLRRPRLRGLGLFAFGNYLINPRNVNNAASQITSVGFGFLPTVQNALVNSVPDSYRVAAGISFPIKGVRNEVIKGLRWNPTYRWEGVRQTDIFGRSDGFRVPGMSMAIDPGISWVYKNNIVNVSVPIVFFRRADSNLAQLEGSPFRTNALIPAVSFQVQATRIF